MRFVICRLVNFRTMLERGRLKYLVHCQIFELIDLYVRTKVERITVLLTVPLSRIVDNRKSSDIWWFIYSAR